ncbi:hypothetical protein [Tateyamaria sp.]|uniref:hypothetical protein n=1 Tax=Tateyamaria sp. TaxID=1929288 RepID=UPI00329D2039
MMERYKEYNKRTGSLSNPNHRTTKQRVSRIRWKHSKIDELMVGHFGKERVDEFYQEINVAKHQAGEIQSAKRMEP